MAPQVPENEVQPVTAGTLGRGPFVNPIAEFYLTNPIARASPIMAELAAMAAARGRPALAAE